MPLPSPSAGRCGGSVSTGTYPDLQLGHIFGPIRLPHCICRLSVCGSLGIRQIDRARCARCALDSSQVGGLQRRAREAETARTGSKHHRTQGAWAQQTGIVASCAIACAPAQHGPPSPKRIATTKVDASFLHKFSGYVETRRRQTMLGDSTVLERSFDVRELEFFAKGISTSDASNQTYPMPRFITSLVRTKSDSGACLELITNARCAYYTRRSRRRI